MWGHSNSISSRTPHMCTLASLNATFFLFIFMFQLYPLMTYLAVPRESDFMNDLFLVSVSMLSPLMTCFTKLAMLPHAVSGLVFFIMFEATLSCAITVYIPCGPFFMNFLTQGCYSFTWVVQILQFETHPLSHTSHICTLPLSECRLQRSPTSSSFPGPRRTSFPSSPCPSLATSCPSC